MGVFESKGQKNYTQSFCAYLDILGFKEKIKKNDLVYFNEYLAILDSILKYLDSHYDLSGEQDFKGFELKIFTDNFVFGYPWFDEYGEWELGQIFYVLAYIQLNFAVNNIFIRGGIAVSNLYMDERVVLGPAVIEAYDLEIKKAIYPRIVLSEEVRNIVHKHINYYGDRRTSPQNQTFLIDTDGCYFVNYLELLSEYERESAIEMLKKHREQINFNLIYYKDDAKVFPKFNWMANYHNFYCYHFTKSLQINVEEIIVEDRILKKEMSRIIN